MAQIRPLMPCCRQGAKVLREILQVLQNFVLSDAVAEVADLFGELPKSDIPPNSHPKMGGSEKMVPKINGLILVSSMEISIQMGDQ